MQPGERVGLTPERIDDVEHGWSDPSLTVLQALVLALDATVRSCSMCRGRSLGPQPQLRSGVPDQDWGCGAVRRAEATRSAILPAKPHGNALPMMVQASSMFSVTSL